MIKIILGVIVTVFILVSTVVILYWRDIQFNPSGSDIFIFFGLLPVSISLLLLMPYLIRVWYLEQQQKKNNPQQQEENDEKVQVENEETEWSRLHIFSANALSALGENALIWDGLISHKSPELDEKLLNAYGLPILSLRINEIDEAIDEDDESFLSTRQQRMHLLIQYQIEQSSALLWSIAAHLKQSALFYEGQNLHEYRMHPAWIDPHHVETEGDSQQQVEQRIEPVQRLDLLNIHLILNEDVLHTWDEFASNQFIETQLEKFGFIPQKFHVELHYWGKYTAYELWIELLQKISNDPNQLSFVFVVDTEIDQETVDEKIWISDNYLPSEFAASCCIAHPSFHLHEFSPVKSIHLAKKAMPLMKTLEEIESHQLDQFKEEAPFVIQLDDMTNVKVSKQLDTTFLGTPIEPHHYLLTASSLGNTDQLAKIFNMIVGMQISEPPLAVVYACEQPSTFTFIKNGIIEADPASA